MSDNLVPSRDAYLDLLTALAVSSPHGEIGLSFARTGSRWASSRELMVCGRAVNGSDKSHEISPADLHTEEARKRRVQRWKESKTEHHDLDWVTAHWAKPIGKYCTRRSAFWRVTRRVANQICAAPFDDGAWSSYLAWTNLYHVAPLKTGNPGKPLKDRQRDACVRLLECDVMRLGPRRLLVLAGHDWASPFFTNGVTWSSGAAFVQGSGRWTLPNGQSVAVVVAKHPQGKREDLMTDEVVQEFNRL